MKRGIYIFMGLVMAFLRGFAQEGASNIEFVENKGQWDPRVQFKGELPAGALFLEKTGFSVMLYDTTDLQALTLAHHGVPARSGGSYNSVGPKGAAVPGAGAVASGAVAGRDMLRAHAYRVSFTDASENVEIVPDKPLPGYNNYFIGRDPSKWASNCRVFQGVTYKNLYPNIDVRYYTNNGQLKYDIIVHPGGDISKVRMNYTGPDKLSLHRGKLTIATSVGAVTELAPMSYLYNDQGRTDISSKYVIKNGNTVGFSVPDHDQGATLIIDPTVVFVTFTGSKI
ncbi:MAG TPA: hypothetical protein VGS79_02085, partial [Puia sp.]|nr:hypothetical protein [Puia sp.]